MQKFTYMHSLTQGCMQIHIHAYMNRYIHIRYDKPVPEVPALSGTFPRSDGGTASWNVCMSVEYVCVCVCVSLMHMKIHVTTVPHAFSGHKTMYVCQSNMCVYVCMKCMYESQIPQDSSGHKTWNMHIRFPALLCGACTCMLSSCVCACSYACICMDSRCLCCGVCMYTCKYEFKWSFVRKMMYVCMHVCMYAWMYFDIICYVRKSKARVFHVRVNMCIYMAVFVYTHICIHICATYIFTCVSHMSSHTCDICIHMCVT